MLRKSTIKTKFKDLFVVEYLFLVREPLHGLSFPRLGINLCFVVSLLEFVWNLFQLVLVFAGNFASFLCHFRKCFWAKEESCGNENYGDFCAAKTKEPHGPNRCE